MTIRLGKLRIDEIALAGSANAILGIRDSGKSYDATYQAECMMDAGIPIIGFDPVGVWRFLRVPSKRKDGKGKGYPVVVAGGVAGDLPLTPATAAAIVRAAMQNNVSLVVDLYSMKLSKADWRRIVTDCLGVLLYENGKYGLRHVFMEEAAEFAPQRVGPQYGLVYAEVEKLARMGRNAGLGYTLINQRSEEVNKAVLELCDNLFLHRQKGRNSLTALRKWLDIADVAEFKEITASLSTLPQGECWAWLAGSTVPVRVHVPAKRSMHPSGAAKAKPGRAGRPIDVGKFVDQMKAALAAAEPKKKVPPAMSPPKAGALVAVGDGKSTPMRPVPQGSVVTAQAEIQRLLKVERTRGYAMGARAARLAFVDRVRATKRAFDENAQASRGALDALMRIPDIPALASGPATGVATSIETPQALPARSTPRRTAPSLTGAEAAVERPGAAVALSSEQKVLGALAWWLAVGGKREVTRAQISGRCGWRTTSGHLRNILGALRSKGLVGYPDKDHVALTEAGEQLAPAPNHSASLEDSLRAALDPTQQKIFDFLPKDGTPVERGQITEHMLWSPTSGHLRNVLGSMSSMDIIEYAPDNGVSRARWIVEAWMESLN